MLIKHLYPTAILFLSSFGIHAQQVSNLFERLPVRAGVTSGEAAQVVECMPDSILGYGFDTPADSVLGERRVYHRYGDMAVAVYTFQEAPDLPLFSIDSTVFDAQGLPVFNQLLELDESSGEMEVVERTFAYPHEGAVSVNPTFFSFLQEFFDPTIRSNVAVYDSVTFHEADFFSGMLEPVEQVVNVFTPEGELLESNTYTWRAFDSSWYPSTRRLTFYTAEGKVDYEEVYSWNGSAFVLGETGDYIYDDNDSLRLVLVTDEETGMPVEKLVFTYNTAENSQYVTDSLWDSDAGQWLFLLSLFADIDDQGRLERTEVLLRFFGLTGVRQDYEYIGSSPCPWLSRGYYSEDGENWEFSTKYYYFPNIITSVFEPPAPDWKAYPNPASGGVWLEATPGIPVEIADLNGRRLYKGIVKGRDFIKLPPSASRYVVLTVGRDDTASSRLILMER